MQSADWSGEQNRKWKLGPNRHTMTETMGSKLRRTQEKADIIWREKSSISSLQAPRLRKPKGSCVLFEEEVNKNDFDFRYPTAEVAVGDPGGDVERV